MKKFIYLIFIGLGIMLTNCSSNNHKTDTISEEAVEHDPFKFDSINFYNFMKQSWADLPNDTNNYSFAVVEEELYDSLILDGEKNNKTKVSVLDFRPFGHTVVMP